MGSPRCSVGQPALPSSGASGVQGRGCLSACSFGCSVCRCTCLLAGLLACCAAHACPCRRPLCMQAAAPQPADPPLFARLLSCRCSLLPCRASLRPRRSRARLRLLSSERPSRRRACRRRRRPAALLGRPPRLLSSSEPLPQGLSSTYLCCRACRRPLPSRAPPKPHSFEQRRAQRLARCERCAQRRQRCDRPRGRHACPQT